MSTCNCFFTSSIGRKVLMALSGLALIGFVIAHLIGNLQVFAGPVVFNDYAAFLKGLGPMLWLMRLGLLAVFVLHIACAISLARDNSAARNTAYKKDKNHQASMASLYMLQSGMVLFIFVVIHLLHFTLGKLQPQYFTNLDSLGRHDVYFMLVKGFSSPGYSAIYIIAMIILGAHLSHAIASLFQTLGINGPRITPAIDKGAKAVSTLIVLGFISIPIAVLFKFITIPAGGAL